MSGFAVNVYPYLLDPEQDPKLKLIIGQAELVAKACAKHGRGYDPECRECDYWRRCLWCLANPAPKEDLLDSPLPPGLERLRVINDLHREGFLTSEQVATLKADPLQEDRSSYDRDRK